MVFTFLGMQMFKKLCDVDDQEKKNNGVVAIHLSKTVSQPCVALSHILSVRSSFFHVLYFCCSYDSFS